MNKRGYEERQSVPAASTSPIRIVGIGASAGGLEAFGEMLGALPPDTGMAFVLVQHLDPTHESMLAQLLSRKSVLPVSQVTDAMEVKPNHVYVISPNTRMGIHGGFLRLTPRASKGKKNMPIDHFFKSLAADQKEAAIGVVLSGTATDGTFGLRAIKAEAGICFAQDEVSAKYPGMPASARAAGCVDFGLPPNKIAAELVRIAKELRANPQVSPPPPILPAGSEGAYQKLILLLRNATGVDFTHYKPATIQRRVVRRMHLRKMSSLGKFVESLRHDNVELDALCQDIVIRVTSFFREPETFRALKSKIVPRLIAGQIEAKALRVWVPGCSSGEEAYSIAMTLSECLGERLGKIPAQIFGTDLNEPLIDRARAGVYAGTTLAQVSPERLARFFVKGNGGYRVTQAIRDMCIFARQDLTRDPPFSRIDLISCRNVLIYLEPVLQKRILASFHYALNDNGILLLGKSETLNAVPGLFTELEKSKFFRKTAVNTSRIREAASIVSRPIQRGQSVKQPAADLRNEADHVVWSRYGHAGVIVDENLQILHFRGDTSPYLAPVAGTASLNVLRMVRGELLADLRAAFHKVKKYNTPARREDIGYQSGNGKHQVCLDVIPLSSIDTSERHFLVLFEEARVKPAKTANTPKAEAGAAAKLERELRATREYLQAIIEEQETTNEEMKAANDEVLSNNEELQSSNEELETAKEELQSTNEELATLTEEQLSRNVELRQLNDDLRNILEGLQIPILILDNELRIRRFTPRVEKVFNIMPADIGRPIHNLRTNLDLHDLQPLIARAMETRVAQDQEVRDLEGRYYAMSVRPYMTSNDKIDGVLIVLLDIDAMKRSLKEAERTRDYAEAIVDTVRQPLVVLDPNLLVVTANRSFYETFQSSAEEAKNRSIFDVGGGWDCPALRELLEKILPENARFQDFKLTHAFPRIGLRTLFLNARRLAWDGEVSSLILLAMEDVTDRESITSELRDSRERLRDLTGGLLTAQEEERRRISCELHDDLEQKVAMLIVAMEVLEKGPVLSGESMRGQLTTLRTRTESISEDLRDTAHRLHPSVVDHLGLPAALRSLCADFSKQEKVQVHFRQRNIGVAIPPDIALCLYRVTQEALHNVAKHSSALHATVSLHASRGRILLSISDSGTGFDLVMVKAKRGLGIVSMEERVRLLAGTLTIRSRPVSGTRVVVEVPLPKEAS